MALITPPNQCPGTTTNMTTTNPTLDALSSPPQGTTLQSTPQGFFSPPTPPQGPNMSNATQDHNATTTFQQDSQASSPPCHGMIQELLNLASAPLQVLY